MIRIIWNDNERYWGEKLDIAFKCGISFFIAFTLGLIIGVLGGQEKYADGYKAGLRHSQEMSK